LITEENFWKIKNFSILWSIKALEKFVVWYRPNDNEILQQYGPNNFLARLWWFSIFKYFEKNVGGTVPRQYDWPLPWPRRFLAKHPNRDS